MKRFTFIAAVAGLTLFGVLIAVSGAGEVMEAVAQAGWATAIVTVLRAIAIAVGGFAWWFLFPPGQSLSVTGCAALRFVREGANQLLPVAQVGGDIIGARLATFWRCEPALASASVVADIAVQAGTQLLFAVLGLVMLVWLTGDSEIARYIAGGLVLAGAGIAVFAYMQGSHGSALLLRIARKFAGGRDWTGFAAFERVSERLAEIYAHPGRVLLASAIHMAIWMFGALEVWVALHFMGHPVSFAEALVIESLGQAVRGAAFAVPGGLGIQEGGYIALCALFGIPAGPALALSLLKRVADLVLGLPALAYWQYLEGRRAFRRSEVQRPLPEAGG